MHSRIATFSPIIRSVGTSIKSHSELKLDYEQLLVTKRDLQVAPTKYQYLYPSDLSCNNYKTQLKSDLADMDLMQPFVALDKENTVYLYLPA